MSGTPLASILSRLVDARNRVAWDIRCVRCGYCLFGISCDAVCPECGTAVYPAVYRIAQQMTGVDQLRVIGDPAWLQRIGLAPGAMLLSLAVLVFPSFWVTMIVGLLGVVLFIVVATTPEPNVESELRLRARWLLLVPITAALVTLGVAYVLDMRPQGPLGSSAALGMLAMAASLPTRAMLMYLSEVAKRLADQAPARRLRYCAYATMAFVPLGFILFAGCIAANEWVTASLDAESVQSLAIVGASPVGALALGGLMVVGDFFARASYLARNADRLNQWHKASEQASAGDVDPADESTRP